MSRRIDTLDALVEAVCNTPRQARRRLVALAGAPGSGKSTLAGVLGAALTARGCAAGVVPMDGFHLDNRVLQPLGLLPRKGAPETFDADGFARMIPALGAAPRVYYPVFDRARDIAIAGAGCLDDDCDTVIVEGNYLLLDAPGWQELSPFWDMRVRVDVPMPVLRARLIARWCDAGLPLADATARAESNDLPNAHTVAAKALRCDAVFDGTAPYV